MSVNWSPILSSQFRAIFLSVFCFSFSAFAQKGAPSADQLFDAIQAAGGRVQVNDRDPKNVEIHVELRKTKGTDDLLKSLKNVGGLSKLLLDRSDVSSTGIKHLKACKALRNLNLDSTTITDDDLVQLRDLKSLDSLWLADTKITDVGIGHLTRLKSLKQLGLDNTKVTDQCFESLAELAALEVLRFYGCRNVKGPGLAYLQLLPNLAQLTIANSGVDDAGIQSMFAPLEPDKVKGARGPKRKANRGPMDQLEELYAHGSLLTDASLRPLATLPRLRVLMIGGPGITDAGIADIARMPSLENLQLSGAPITDQGIAGLKDMNRLQRLSIGSGKITDASLEHLANLKNLKELRLGTEPVTDAGVAKLQTALPALKIHRRGG